MEKSLTTQADAVIFDLEDAVPVGEKANARKIVAAFLTSTRSKPIYVRVNGTGTPWGSDDLDALQGAHVFGIRIPKAERAHDVAAICERLWGNVVVHATFESAKGYVAMDEIASAHPRIASIGLGEGDLRSELGFRDDYEFEHARFRLVVASHAAGLGAPMMSVYAMPHDIEGLRASCELGKSTGFFGRATIHPKQVPIVNAVFTPSAAEIEDARMMLREFDEKAAAGSGAFVLPDGRFIDEAIVKAARTTLARAEGKQG